MRILLLFLVILFVDGQLGSHLDRDWDRDMTIPNPQSAVGLFDYLNPEVLHKAAGFPCSGHTGSLSWRQNPNNPLYILFRKQLELSGDLCRTKAILSKLRPRPAKLQLVKREKDVSSYNWNSFGLRYGKRLVGSVKK